MDELLRDLAAGRIDVETARRALAEGAIAEVAGVGRLDAHREARTGLPEIILAEGKDPQQTGALVRRLSRERDQVLVSRLSPEAWQATGLLHLSDHEAAYDAAARFLTVRRKGFTPEPTGGRVGIITAGTSDEPVASECHLVLEALGVVVQRETDCGVAGPQRLAPALKRLLAMDPDVIVVAAGREGTLPTLVSALVPIPVIGLPVSTGYGAGGRGEAALHSMLQSCSPLAVVNIDAGVVAGLMAARIAARSTRDREQALPGVPR